jgi:chorismate mutase-like protein
MRLDKKKLAFFVAWTICLGSRAYAQSANDVLQSLVETSARRLAFAEQVALAKWDSGTPVEDAVREAQVIASATKAGESRGLDPAWVSNFFRAQIEANKLIQYSLSADWRRQSAGSLAGRSRNHNSPGARATGDATDRRVGGNRRYACEQFMSCRYRQGGGQICIGA